MTSTMPLVGKSHPPARRRSDVLPEPLAPSTTHRSPGPTSQSPPVSTGRPGAKERVTPRNARTGACEFCSVAIGGADYRRTRWSLSGLALFSSRRTGLVELGQVVAEVEDVPHGPF